MARVKCIMMQKDEDLVLEPWLIHHGYLFGFENLTIFDNGSNLPAVHEVLNRFEAAGVTIVRRYTEEQDWLAKGDYFTSCIKTWDHTADYDFAIPLDCDEFLALFTETGLTTNRSAIHDYLDTLAGCEDVLSVETTNYNVPGHPGWFWPSRGLKNFFAARTIGMLDHGFHVATSLKSDATSATRLTHLHYQHKPYPVVIEHAKRKLRPHVDINDLDAILAFHGPCEHLVRYFRQSEAEYLRQFDTEMIFGFAGLSAILTAFGFQSELFTAPPQPLEATLGPALTIRLPADTVAPARTLLFDAAAYLRDNIDVAAIGTNGLIHYLYNGYHEHRPVSDIREQGPVSLVF